MGLKQITDLVNIGGTVTETAANTFTEAQIGINLSPVNRQVFVITDVSFTSTQPELIAATQTAVSYQVTKTRQTTLIRANDPDLISSQQKFVFSGVTEHNFAEVDFAGTQQSTGGRNDYLMILATEDAFISCMGQNNVAAASAECRLTGYFATADAATYQALVLSELGNWAGG
jgi:hypothetical protein